MNKVFAFLLLLLASPLLLILCIVVKLNSKGPFIFKQKRAGINKKPFTIYKIRTMIKGAENIQGKYSRLNESDGPVFKIKNDPRYTNVGKFLARSALDEIPQLWNVVKGDMAFVGPRPLPLSEANKIPQKYKLRFSILPGMTSTWVVKGNHKLSFKKWMELDSEYINQKSLLIDSKLLILTINLILNNLRGRAKK